MLYTDADYVASNACYEKIGYVLRGKVLLNENDVETVVCLDKKKPKDYIEIGVDAEDYYKIKDSEEAR